MVGSLYKEFSRFSKENWWIYLLLFFCLGIIYITSSGNIAEILAVFFVYVVADICIMNMIVLMDEKNHKMASMFQLLGNTIFTILFVYHFFQSGQLQYILGSTGFILSAVKNISKYHFQVPLSFINGTSLFIMNVIIFVWAYSFLWNVTFQILFQALGWTFFTSCLVIDDIYRRWKYLLGLIGLSSMVIGSSIGLYVEFFQWNIYGVTLCYFLLPLSVLVVYLKTWRNYL